MVGLDAALSPALRLSTDYNWSATKLKWCVQGLTLWLQYITLLGDINISAPGSVQWIFKAASFAFSTVTSDCLSPDCLLSEGTNLAVQRVLLHLAVPPIVLLTLVLMQSLW